MQIQKILASFLVSGMLVSGCSTSANASSASPIYNLQQLEQQAETGDVEAQLRLLEFYKRDRLQRELHSGRQEYWAQKLEGQQQSAPYIAAKEKLKQEVLDKLERHEKLMEQKKVEAKALQEKFEKNPPRNKDEKDAQTVEAIFSLYDYDKIYRWDEPQAWRFRLTINIQTPEGLKTGSTVEELYFPPADKKDPMNENNRGIAHGEATYVDLGERGLLFAILPDKTNARNRFSEMVRTVFPTVPAIHDNLLFSDIVEHYGALRNVKDTVPAWQYPVLVHFRDINDPSSMEVVYRHKEGSIRDAHEIEINRLEEIFGKDVHIQDMTLEMTDAPLEWKLEKKLPWIETTSEGKITAALRESKPYIRIINGISYDVLRQAQEPSALNPQ